MKSLVLLGATTRVVNEADVMRHMEGRPARCRCAPAAAGAARARHARRARPHGAASEHRSTHTAKAKRKALWLSYTNVKSREKMALSKLQLYWWAVGKNLAVPRVECLSEVRVSDRSAAAVPAPSWSLPSCL